MGLTPPICDWCSTPIHGQHPAARFCSRRCRQSAWRLRQQTHNQPAANSSLTFAYADPPYPGRAARYYRHQPDYQGEVDFPALIMSLTAANYAGWALSTSADSLAALLPLCPPTIRICPWVKPIAPNPNTRGLHNTWEPLLVVPGRELRPGIRDWLSAQPARNGGTLPGRKPIAFCAFLFASLGMQPDDKLVDLYPGTGIVTTAWEEVSRGSCATHSTPSVVCRGKRRIPHETTNP